MLRLLNLSLTILSAASITWYKVSSAELWPVLGCFIVFFSVGSVTVIASFVRSRTLWLLAAGLNGLSVALLIALLIAAFVLSPGSGIAAVAFAVVPLVVNVISLTWIGAEVRSESI